MDNILSFCKALAYALFLYLGIKTEVVKILFVLMMLDTFIGIIKALRLGEKFSFKKLGWGIVSKLTILIVPMVVALIGKGLHFDLNYFVIAIMSIIIVSEGISIITNVLAIRQKKDINNDDYITLLLKAVRKQFILLVTRLIDKTKIDES